MTYPGSAVIDAHVAYEVPIAIPDDAVLATAGLRGFPSRSQLVASITTSALAEDATDNTRPSELYTQFYNTTVVAPNLAVLPAMTINHATI